MIRAVDMGSTFALARYAAEKAKSLVDQIPGGSLGVGTNLDDKWGRRPWTVDIGIHRALSLHGGLSLAPMVLQASYLANTEEVDEAIEKLREIVENQSWQLDDSEKAAA